MVPGVGVKGCACEPLNLLLFYILLLKQPRWRSAYKFPKARSDAVEMQWARGCAFVSLFRLEKRGRDCVCTCECECERVGVDDWLDTSCDRSPEGQGLSVCSNTPNLESPSPGLHHRNSTQVSSTQSQDLNISCYLNLQLQSCPTDFKLNSLSNNSMSQFLKISPSINQLTSVSLSVPLARDLHC